jgi:hypothetical protein
MHGYFQEFPLGPTDLFTKFLKIPTNIQFYGTSDFSCHRSTQASTPKPGHSKEAKLFMSKVRSRMETLFRDSKILAFYGNDLGMILTSIWRSFMQWL